MAYCLPLSFAYHESSQSWRELLGQLKRLGLSGSPKLVIDDGSLGFWVALQEEYGPITQQRLLGAQDSNILDKMPKLKGFKRSQR